MCFRAPVSTTGTLRYITRPQVIHGSLANKYLPIAASTNHDTFDRNSGTRFLNPKP